MVTTRCFCGELLDAAVDGALVTDLREHIREAHGSDATEVGVRNFIERGWQMGPVPPRVESRGEIEFVALGSGHRAEYLRFFDEDAFTDNVGWASCYCLFPHADQSTFDDRTWQDIRAAVDERLGSGRHHGYLALSEGRIVGWCNAGPASSYSAYSEPDDPGRSAIVCFVIAPAFRGHGIARDLLDVAVSGLREAGFTSVEAYPKADAESAASAYRGTPNLYRSAGFAIQEDGSARLALTD